MKSLAVYYSKYGNTQQVAEHIASTLNSFGASQAISLEQLSPKDLSGIDLVIMGCPTHIMNIPKAVRPLLKALPKRCLKGTRTVVFDTSYKMPRWLEPFTAAKRLKNTLRSLGSKLVDKPETFHVMESEVPLYEGEIERAQTSAAALVQKVSRQLQ